MEEKEKEKKNKSIKTPFDFYRIIIIGRPIELSKLVYDDFTFIEQQDVQKITKAFQLYSGYQSLGTLTLWGFLISFLFKINKIKHKKLILFTGVSLSMFIYCYSFFSYWDLIRPIVIKSRQIRKEFDLLENRDEKRIKLQASLDNHDDIKNQISYLKCLKQAINLTNLFKH